MERQKSILIFVPHLQQGLKIRLQVLQYGTPLSTVQDETLLKLRPTQMHMFSTSVAQSKNSLLQAV
jgi:hypothetical protein